MQNRELKSMLATLVGSLCLTAAAYAASGPASGTSATTSPGSAGTPVQTGSDTPAGSPAAGAASPAAEAAPTAKYSDGEIVAAVLAVDENEILAAEAAGKKKIGKDAAKFAKMLLKQHRADSSKVSQLAQKEKIALAENAAKAQELRAKGAADLQSLSAKDSLEFEQGYIGAMVQGHTEALALLDEHLLKDAANKKLKKQLEETRKHVAHHLEEAKRLQSDRASR